MLVLGIGFELESSSLAFLLVLVRDKICLQ